MYGVGSRIAVGDDDPALFIEGPPIRFISRETVRSVKTGCRISIYIRGIPAEIAAQVHPDQRRGIGLIVGKRNLADRESLPGKRFVQKLRLGCLSGSIQPLDHIQFSFFQCISISVHAFSLMKKIVH